MMDFNDIDPLWNLHDTLTVTAAAALMAGYDPAKLEMADNLDPEKQEAERREGVAFSALTNAINAGKIRAQLCYDAEPRYMAGRDNLIERQRWSGEDVSEVIDEEGTPFVITATPNWGATTIDRQDLVDWLDGRWPKTGFFFPAATETADYLDPAHPRYAPKLAAAVRAWEAMEDENLLVRTKPRDAMKAWLKINYKKFDLTHRTPGKKGDGTQYKIGDINNGAIDDVTKVSNWDNGGPAKHPD